MIRTKIPWTDRTWNPITGCNYGCSYCYARKMAVRFNGHFTPTIHEDRLGQPARVKAPSRVFVCSMADLFGVGVPDQWITLVTEAMRQAPWHTYQLLTKRPARMVGFYSLFPAGVWYGATATDQASWDHACEQLARLPRQVTRFISAEPVLSPIIPMRLPDWVIIGPLTGGKAVDREESLRHAVRLRADLYGRRPIYDKETMPRPWVSQWPRGDA